MLQRLSKVLVDEIFMHYFEKMSSASGGFAAYFPGSDPGIRWGTSVLQTSSLPTPRKNTAGAHGVYKLQRGERRQTPSVLHRGDFGAYDHQGKIFSN